MLVTRLVSRFRPWPASAVALRAGGRRGRPAANINKALLRAISIGDACGAAPPASTSARARPGPGPPRGPHQAVVDRLLAVSSRPRLASSRISSTSCPVTSASRSYSFGEHRAYLFLVHGDGGHRPSKLTLGSDMAKKAFG
jgi:hypothetical protein